MHSIIENNKEQIIELCKRHHVKELFVFGSAARDKDFSDESDIDILVNFQNLSPDTNEQVFYIVENRDKLEEQLKKVFKRNIDLIEEKNISNKYLRYFINKDKRLLYGVS
ncbi:MAG: nucleotidyltransferase family protein [Chitinophagaceae bacterium]